MVGLGDAGNDKKDTPPALPDLVLLDIMMPDMDGYQVLQELRKKYPKALLPIILVSARNTTEDVVKGFSFGCNDYVTKPCEWRISQ